MFKSIKEKLTEYETKYNTSVKLIQKVSEIVKPYSYGGDKYNNIFRIDLRIESVESVRYKYIEAKQGILRALDISDYDMKRIIFKSEDLDKQLNNLGYHEMFKAAAFRQFYYDTKYNRPDNFKFTGIINSAPNDYKPNNLKFTTGNFGSYDGFGLLLNCIWLLNHDDLMPADVFNKVRNLASSGETFIFNTCKVATYKNRRVDVHFSDYKMINSFQISLFLARDEMFKFMETEKQEA